MRNVYLMLCCVVSVSAVNGQAARNEDILNQRLPSDDGYRERTKDLRYEGLYTQNVAGELLEVVSLTFGDIRYALDPKDKIVVSCPALPAYKMIGVTGTSFHLNKHYHLDMVLEPAKKKSIPLGEVISRNFIMSDHLGMYGYVGNPEAPTVYIPLKVSSSTSAPSDQIKMVLVSNKDLTGLRWKYAASGNGIAAKFTTGPPPVKEGPYYLSSDPIVIPFTPMEGMTSGSEWCVVVETLTAGEKDWMPLTIKILVP